MTPTDGWILAGLGMVAFLYSTVGHAGASGYLAVFALAGWGSEVSRPTVLILNLAVSMVVAIQFWKAGHLRWNLWWPFAITSVPASFFAARIPLPVREFKWVVAALLAFSAVRLLFPVRTEQGSATIPRPAVAMGWGILLGGLAGWTGTGGGIFLTPLLLFRGWAAPKAAGAASAAFIVVNSAAGLAGWTNPSAEVFSHSLRLVPVVILAGFLGSHLGARKLDSPALRRLLACVLLVAMFKLLPVSWRWNG